MVSILIERQEMLLMKKIPFIVLAIAMELHIKAKTPLMFTEVCVANIDQTINYSYNYGSWVEVYYTQTGVYYCHLEGLLKQIVGPLGPEFPI